MGRFTPASGIIRRRPRKDMVFKYGQMDQNMKDSGTKTWQEDLVGSYWLTAMFIRVHGVMTRLMGKVNISMQKELHTKAAGTKTNKKVEVKKSGQTVRFIKDAISKEKNTVKAHSNGLMEPSIMATGKITKCMVEDNLIGLTVVCMMVIIQMIRNMDKVSIHGLTGECIMGDFIMENSTAKEHINKRINKKFTVYGRKERKASYVRTEMNLMS